MTTLTIHIPAKKASLVKQLLMELDVKIETIAPVNPKKLHHTPNAETIKAIEDARKGKTKRITNFKTFFDSI